MIKQGHQANINHTASDEVQYNDRVTDKQCPMHQHANDCRE